MKILMKISKFPPQNGGKIPKFYQRIELMKKYKTFTHSNNLIKIQNCIHIFKLMKISDF